MLDHWDLIFSFFFLFPETYSCSLRLKSSAEEDQIKTQPGSSEAFILYVPLFVLVIIKDLSFYFFIGGS